MTEALASWGWTPFFADQLAGRPPGRPGRVLAEHRGYYDVVTAEGVLEAVAVTPAHRRSREDAADFPATGDWILLDEEPTPAISDRLDRRSVLVRRSPRRLPAPQVLAANCDTAFIVTSVTDDLNPRRVERQLVVVLGGRVEPVVVVTKSDLVDDPDRAREVLADVTGDRVPIVIVSNVSGEGMADLDPWLATDRTIALLGSSGVGKSSLVNRLLGDERQPVEEVRDDGRGRHTTVRRELLRLPCGALVIDTPGLREVQPWDGAGIDEVFAEVAATAERCRFVDCRHESEPGCAVRSAVEAGALSGARVRSYRELADELAATAAELEQHRRSGQRRSSLG